MRENPHKHWPKTREPRRLSARGSLLTGAILEVRFRSSGSPDETRTCALVVNSRGSRPLSPPLGLTHRRYAAEVTLPKALSGWTTPRDGCATESKARRITSPARPLPRRHPLATMPTLPPPHNPPAPGRASIDYPEVPAPAMPTFQPAFFLCRVLTHRLLL